MGKEMQELLQEPGYKVLDVASSGDGAIKAARLYSPDLVLMDIKLKGAMNGIEAAQNMRLFTQVPIMFITGYKNSNTTEQASAIQNTFLITKPFDPEKLGTMVKKILSN